MIINSTWILSWNNGNIHYQTVKGQWAFYNFNATQLTDYLILWDREPLKELLIYRTIAWNGLRDNHKFVMQLRVQNQSKTTKRNQINLGYKHIIVLMCKKHRSIKDVSYQWELRTSITSPQTSMTSSQTRWHYHKLPTIDQWEQMPHKRRNPQNRDPTSRQMQNWIIINKSKQMQFLYSIDYLYIWIKSKYVK